MHKGIKNIKYTFRPLSWGVNEVFFDSFCPPVILIFKRAAFSGVLCVTSPKYDNWKLKKKKKIIMTIANVVMSFKVSLK